MCYTIKAELQTSAVTYYKNVIEKTPDLIATNITVCNITGTPATVFLSFTNKDLVFETGSILSAYSLGAHSFIQISDRRINPDQTIQAYSGTANAIILSVDILGDNGEYSPPV